MSDKNCVPSTMLLMDTVTDDKYSAAHCTEQAEDGC